MADPVTEAIRLARDTYTDPQNTFTPEFKRVLSRLPSADLVEVIEGIAPMASNNNSSNNNVGMATEELLAEEAIPRAEVMEALREVPTTRIRNFLVQEGLIGS